MNFYDMGPETGIGRRFSQREPYIALTVTGWCTHACVCGCIEMSRFLVLGVALDVGKY